MTSNRPVLIPRRIGKYSIRGELGIGSSGVVYHAFDPFVQREVALKVALAPRHSPVGEEAHRRSFFAEARAAGRLHHPNIVAVYDAGAEGPLNYLAMALVDGQTLQALMRDLPSGMAVAQAVEIIVRCAEALDYAHRAGVLHRDLKPANIMLTREGEPRLMDFSIAAVGHASGNETLATLSIPREHGPVGSPLYMAPEQVMQQPLSARTDLYALGAVFFELLTGSPPFPVEDDLPTLFRCIREQAAPRVDLLRPEVPREIADVIAALLEKQPEARPGSGQALAARLSGQRGRGLHGESSPAHQAQREWLPGLAIFGAFSEAQAEALLERATRVTFAAGEVVISDGGHDEALYLILRGEAEVFSGERSLDRLGPGACFGEAALLPDRQRRGRVVIRQPTQCLRLDPSQMAELSPDCQLHLYRLLTELLVRRLASANARIPA